MIYSSEPRWLSLKIKATNKANDIANRLYRQMADVFGNLVGQKILKADGSFTKKVEALVPKPIGSGADGVHVYKSYSGKWAVSWTVRVTVFDGDDHVDAEATAYVCEMEGDTVKCLHSQSPLKTDYDFLIVQTLRELAKMKKKEYDEAQSACYPFEERHG